MKLIKISAFLITVIFLFNSCQKQEYLKSESGIRSELLGTWNLIPIPRYDKLPDGSKYIHVESWTFTESTVSMINNGQSASSSYSIHTSWTKAEIKIESVKPEMVSPARIRINNGTWQIVKLDDNFLTIANDQDGTTGLTELEFEKKK